MDLCIDARMIDSGGIGTILKKLIPSLSASPFRTTLLTTASQKVGKICKAPIYSIREQFSLPYSIPRCDLFWSPHYNIPLLPIRAKKRAVTIHDAYHLAFSHCLHFQEKLYARMMFQQAVFRSDLVFTVSLFSQKELCKYLSIPPSKIRVIYPGIDFDRFSREMPQNAIRKKYSLPSSFFLFVGNVKPHKNLRLILEAYKHFSIEIPLVVVGKIKGLLTPDLSILNSQCLHLEDVSDEELPAFYQMATALIFPSLYEGFGFPPLEAMAAGCPAIVSNRASIPEACGEAAYFIDPENFEELATAMIRIASDTSLREKFKQKGKIQARKFSWDRMAKEYVKIFQEVCTC